MRRRTTASTWASAAAATTSTSASTCKARSATSSAAPARRARANGRRAGAARARVPTTTPTMSATAGSSAPTADGAKNYKLVEARRRRCRARPRSLARPRAARADVFIENFQPFESFIAIEERARRQQAHPPAQQFGTAAATSLSDEPAYAMDDRRQSRSDTRPSCATLIDSLTTPEITYEVDVNTRRAHGAQARRRRPITTRRNT